MFKRIFNYLKTMFRIKAENAMDPEIEIEQAIEEARKQDRQLRNQAAKVIAHREQLETKIEKSADQVGEEQACPADAAFEKGEVQVGEALGDAAQEYGFADRFAGGTKVADVVVAEVRRGDAQGFAARSFVECR